MDIRYTIPIITDRELQDFTKYIETVDPGKIELSNLEIVLGQMGKFLVAEIPLPSALSTWLEMVPSSRLIMSRVIYTTVISNANFIMAKRVEQCCYALAALNWINQG